MVFGPLDKAQDEGGNAHYCIRLQALNGVPLEFRNAVTNADDAGTQFPDAKEVGQAGHKALVQRYHKLDDASGTYARALKTLLLIVGKPLEILFRAPEGDGVSHSAGCGDIVNHLLPGHAEEFLVEQLKVLFLRERYLLEILYGLYPFNVYMALLKHPAVILGICLQVSESVF